MVSSILGQGLKVKNGRQKSVVLEILHSEVVNSFRWSHKIKFISSHSKLTVYSSQSCMGTWSLVAFLCHDASPASANCQILFPPMKVLQSDDISLFSELPQYLYFYHDHENGKSHKLLDCSLNGNTGFYPVHTVSFNDYSSVK